MDLGIGGKSALVSAASKGLGRACARALAREGARVAIGARDKAQLEQTAAEIRRETGGDVRALPVDVTNAEQCRAFFQFAEAAFGRVDILINNAGGPPFGRFETFDDDAWLAAWQANLMSAVRLTRLVLPAMKAARWGRIVNITSLSTKSVLPNSVLSTASRLGVVGMAKLLSDEVAASGITVNNVAPGIILTDRVRTMQVAPRLARGMDESSALDEIAREIPVRRVGSPEELAELVVFLASPLAGYITGTTIPVDGGAIRSLL